MSELLIEASRLLSSSTYSNAASNSTRPPAIPQATINETLRRAQGILSESSSTGLCRRLNRQERLRAAAGTSHLRTSQAKKNYFAAFISNYFKVFKRQQLHLSKSYNVLKLNFERKKRNCNCNVIS